MQSFRILYFRDNVLDHDEEVQVNDLLEAIQKASGKAPELRSEVWAENRRVAEIGTSLPDVGP